MTIKRINVNGGAFTDAQGNQYDADAGEFNGALWNHGRNISSTIDDTLYQTGKFATSISGSVPVTNGDYLVRLHFAEHIDRIAVSGETISTQTIESAKSNFFYSRHWQSALFYDVDNDDRYYSWTDNLGSPKRTLINKNGGTPVVISSTTLNDEHKVSSIGMDKNGYIHIAWNVHQNSPGVWSYAVSKQPYDIGTDSSDWNYYHQKYAETNPPNTTVLDDIRGLPGFRPSYPHFVSHPITKELFVFWRGRVNHSHSTPYQFGATGSQAVLGAHYDLDTDPANPRWVEVGGSSHPDYPYDLDCIYWNDSYRNNSGQPLGYQEYQTVPYVDLNGRWHIAAGIFVYDGPEISHIVYAYTDDIINGPWHQSDGSVVADLPMIATQGQNNNINVNADIVAFDLSADLCDTVKVYALEDSTPIVACRGKSPNNNWEAWISDNAGTWTALPLRPNSPDGSMIGRGRYFGTTENGNDLLRSYDKGSSFTRFNVNNLQRDSNHDALFNWHNPNQFRWAANDGSIVVATSTPNDVQSFSVELEGAQVESEIDILKTTGGPDKALIKEYNVNVSNGSMDITLDGLLSQNASLSAVEIIEQPLPFVAEDITFAKVNGNTIYKNSDPVTILASDILEPSTGTGLSILSVDSTSNCMATLDGGNITFTPATDFFNNYAEFTLTITDGTQTDTILVRVNVGVRILM